MTNMTGSKLHIFTPRENNRLLDYYKIISISRPILARTNMGLDFVSGQYGCLFSRCQKYVINSLIHGHFHIGLVIGPRRKIWYCLIKTRIDLVSLSFSNEIYKKNRVNSISIRPMDIKIMWNFVQSESSY
jgi:hypothetical protein